MAIDTIKPEKNKQEIRVMADTRIAIREDSGEGEDASTEIKVEGYAAVFGVETNIGGWFIEEIAKGAFKKAIKDDDVRFLINHGGLPLARNTSKTLTLSEDDHGLKVVASLDPKDPDVQNIIPKMERGDLTQMSFAFMPEVSEWDDTVEPAKRTIKEAKLFDVSIVTFPQYEEATIALRGKQSLEDYKSNKPVSNVDRRLNMRSRILTSLEK